MFFVIGSDKPILVVKLIDGQIKLAVPSAKIRKLWRQRYRRKNPRPALSPTRLQRLYRQLQVPCLN